MLLAVVLLYVGAVLVINGIWLVGQARAATAAAPAPASVGGRGAEPAAVASEPETHPTFMQNREVAVMNFFTGFIGAILALTLLIQGSAKGDAASIRGGGFIFLFAFTYLYVAINQFLNQGGHAFGWYCLFVAITAVPAGIYTLSNTGGKDASVWLGIDWFAWAVLWFMFFLLLALDRPIARTTGYATVLVGIGTSWVLGFLVMIEKLSF
jgi:putative amide transporter protein